MSFPQNTFSANNNTAESIKESTTEETVINNHSTKITQHDVSPFKRGRKKQRLPEVDATKPCFVHQLSVELITHIFSRLDPVSLAVVAKVCSYWRHIILDDNCWRNAFVAYFGSLPFKRLSTESWKSEYILRTHLVRKWTKGRGTVLSFNPKIGSLEKIQVDLDESSMLVASTEHGVAARCNPMTGKVAQRHLFYSTNEHVRQEVSSVVLDKDRILWGFGQGYITLNTRTKSSTSRRQIFSEFHQGPVCVLNLPQHVHDVVLSGSEDDGTVKVWDAKTSMCIWTFYPESATIRKPTVLETTADHQILIGYDDGSLLFWNMNLNQLLQLHREHNGEVLAQKRHELRNTLEKSKIAIAPQRNPVSGVSLRLSVNSLIYDNETNTVVVAYNGKTDVQKFCTLTGKCVNTFTNGHTAASSITCMKWDKHFSGNTYSLASVVKPRSAVDGGTSGQKLTSSIIDLSSVPADARSPATSLPSSGISTPTTSSYKATRLLVTGDDLGVVCVWDGDAIAPEDGSFSKPLRVLSGHITSISAIHVDACKIVTGSDDGWIRVWDPLTGDNITTFGNKIPKNAPVDRSDVNVMRVKNLFCNDYQGVATIGHQVKSWDFSPGQQRILSRRALKQRSKPYNIVLRDKLKNEMEMEVKESIEKLKTEKQDMERAQREFEKLSLGGLSDEEMLAYAMMLSSQQGECSESTLKQNAHSSDYVDVEDEELMKALIASLEHGDDAAGSSANLDTDTYNSPYNDIEQWPTVDEASSGESSTQAQDNVDTTDDELQYVLELSKHEK